MNSDSEDLPENTVEEPLLRVDDEAKEHYPAALIDLAHRCVQRAPKDRITVAELCERIEEEVNELRQADLSDEDMATFPWYNRYKDLMASVGLMEATPTP